MLRLPFVGRGRFEDAQATIRELREQLRELREERVLLSDVIAARATGVSIYGRFKLPGAQQEEEEVRQQSPEKDSEEPIAIKREEVMPIRARDYARKKERENLEVMHNLEKEEAAVHLIRDAIDRGKRLAVAATTGETKNDAAAAV